MSESQPQSGPGAFFEALNVTAHAKRGFVAAAVLTAAVFAFFVVIPGAERSPLLYLGLAFVLFVSLGGLFTAILAAGTLFRQVRQL